jgi:HK97 family phage portal protein
LGKLLNIEFRDNGTTFGVSNDLLFSASGGYGVSSSGVVVTPQRAQQLLTAFSCVALRGRTIANLRAYVGQIQPGTNDIVEVPEHPLNKLLQLKMNPQTGEFNFFETCVMHIDLWGNFYAIINRNFFGDVVRLTQIADPSSVTLKVAKGNETLRDNTTVLAKKGQLFYAVAIPGEGVKNYPTKRILHIANISQNGIEGLSQVGIYRQSVGLLLAAQEYQGRFFANGTHPSGVVSIDGYLEENIEIVTRKMEQDFSRLGRGETPIVVLEGADTTYLPLSMSMRDAEFVTSQDWTAHTVAGWFGVPPNKVGLQGSSAYNSLSEENSAWKTDTVVPLGQRITKPMTNQLLSQEDINRNLRVLLDYSPFMADLATQATADRKYFEMGLPANVIMAKRGYPDLGPDGDISHRPANLVHLGQVTDGKIAIQTESVTNEE